MTTGSGSDLALENVYHWEKARAGKVYLTQPLGGGPVREWTWAQAMDEVRRMANHLRSLGLPPESHIALMAKNQAQWIMADLAIWMAGHVTIPLYPTLAAETVGQILSHSESKLLLVGKLDDWETMKAGVPNDLPRIGLPLGPLAEVSGIPFWEDIVSSTEPLRDSPTRDRNDLATIVYTSGSTGIPKGVMHSFGTMGATAKGVVDYLGITAEDRVLSYLPLAHVFERWIVECTSFMAGYHLFFAETLNTFVQDLNRARPTLFISVPRLWLKFQQGVHAKMPPAKLDRLLRIPILRRFVAKKVLNQLGLDHVRFAGSGSAPIPGEVIEWYRRLGLELLEGYGMSENFAYSHVTRPGEVRVGYVGGTYPGVHCRISEVGEIEVKSPGTMLGYYKAPDLTAECLTPDGYLKTGDRGEIDEKGRLKITGRVKELFKTSKGKYVSPAPIENKLLTHEHVEQCCVTGHGQPQPHAIVQLSEETRAALEAGRISREQVAAELEALIEKVNETLDPHEHLEFLAIAQSTWAVENGYLTPTLKLKRAKVESEFTQRAEEWYSARKRVLWS